MLGSLVLKIKTIFSGMSANVPPEFFILSRIIFFEPAENKKDGLFQTIRLKCCN